MALLRNKKIFIISLCLLVTIVLSIGMKFTNNSREVDKIIKNYNELVELYNTSKNHYLNVLRDNGCDEDIVNGNLKSYDVFQENKFKYIMSSELRQQLSYNAIEIENNMSLLNDNVIIADEYFSKVKEYNENIRGFLTMCEDYAPPLSA